MQCVVFICLAFLFRNNFLSVGDDQVGLSIRFRVFFIIYILSGVIKTISVGLLAYSIFVPYLNRVY